MDQFASAVGYHLPKDYKINLTHAKAVVARK